VTFVVQHAGPLEAREQVGRARIDVSAVLDPDRRNDTTQHGCDRRAEQARPPIPLYDGGAEVACRRNVDGSPFIRRLISETSSTQRRRSRCSRSISSLYGQCT